MEGDMKRVLITAVAMIFLLAGCAAKEEKAAEHHGAMTEGHGHGDAKVTKHFDDSLTKLTDKGLYSLELVIPEKHLMMGVNTVEIIVHHGKGGDVAQADVTVIPWMPSMGHGVMEKPKITERGGGLYSVENVVLSMTGHWQLRVAVNKDGAEDSAVFEFPEVKAMGHEQHMMHAPPPKDLDMSTMKMSGHKHFKVMYESLVGRLPLNKIHSWKLSVQDDKGNAVNGAKITVVGDMPEHGHGLPTNPEVSKDSGPGAYRVDGMKFSMPGWWVITFNIKAGEMQDSVSFNVQVH
jgi:hypothetical protein